MPVQTALYGNCYHQVQWRLVNEPRALPVAAAAINREDIPEEYRDSPDFHIYETLDELLSDDRVELVSLASPRRADQAAEAIRCLRAGKHVYAEKPCALTEEDLDAIIKAADSLGGRFHEMAGTAFEAPYWKMREIIASGKIGTVVEVYAQKSYPYHDRRPQDEAIDGGLLMQAGVHGLRFIEHVGGVRIKEVQAVETKLGNPEPGGLHMAAACIMTLENGGVASMVANYLNPKDFGTWGNETLRVWGTEGFIEATDAGKRTRLVLDKEDQGSLRLEEPPPPDFFARYLDNLLYDIPMPFSLEDELHPTRIAIRAKLSAEEHRDGKHD